MTGGMRIPRAMEWTTESRYAPRVNRRLSWNHYAGGSVLQEAELSQAQDSPPGPQRQPAASRPATAGAAGTGPAGVRAAAAGATGGSGSGGVPGAGLSPGWRRA